MTKYPEDSLQGVVEAPGHPWWELRQPAAPCRGRLIWAILPHVDKEPYRLVPEDRAVATVHERFVGRIEPLRIAHERHTRPLPVAALPDFPGEHWLLSRAKKRPCLVIGCGGLDVPKALRTGGAGWQTAATIQVAPYYGVDRNGKRAGWRPEFVERIRRCEYPQYVWDKLPLSGATESILRLDHLQPVGNHQNSYECTPYCLCQDGLDLVDEWLDWLLLGNLDPKSGLAMFREQLVEIVGAGFGLGDPHAR